MTSRSSYVTVTDQFCGAGGSSLGAVAAGAELRLAMNHWKLAITTHNTNFPQADHVCCDVSATDPRRYPSTDVLITSPECTNHSLAKGARRKGQGQLDLWGKGAPDPSEERSRTTMWDVPRFAEHHDYRLIIVENVVDVRQWRLYNAWMKAMDDLDYLHQAVYLNSMFCHPTPQSRDRLYVVFWKKGNRAPDLRFCPPAYCPRCARDVAAAQSWKKPHKPWGRYGAHGQYVYRCPHCADAVSPYYYCAASAIDWTLPGRRIGDIQESKRPLKDRTIERIRYGLAKYRGHPYLDNMYTPRGQPSTHGTDDPLGTITTMDHHRLIQPPIPSPFLLNVAHAGAPGSRTCPTDAPAPTQTAQQEHALIVGTGTCPPNFVRPATGPYPTATGTTSLAFVIHPNSRNRKTEDVATDPLPTQTSSLGHALILSPGGTWADEPHTTLEPCPTLTTRESYGIATLATLRNHGSLDSLAEPTTTVCAGGNHHALVYDYRRRPGDAISPPTEPLSTVTTIDHQAKLDTDDNLPDVLDCSFRMLAPHEIQAAMAFPPAYQVLGTKRQRVKQLGNAVTPPALEFLLRRCLDTLD